MLGQQVRVKNPGEEKTTAQKLIAEKTVAEKENGFMKYCTKDDCTEAHCREADCGEGAGSLAYTQLANTQAGPGGLYCTEEHCTEEYCAEEIPHENRSFGEEEATEDPPEVSLFICQMAFALIEGMVTPDDIYEGMILANCGDKEVARYIRDRAIAEATLYRKTEGLN